MEFIELFTNTYGRFQTSYFHYLNVIHIQNTSIDIFGNRCISTDIDDSHFFITFDEWDLLKMKMVDYISLSTTCFDQFEDLLYYTFETGNIHVTFRKEAQTNVIVLLVSRLLFSGFEEGYQIIIPVNLWDVFENNLDTIFNTKMTHYF